MKTWVKAPGQRHAMWDGDLPPLSEGTRLILDGKAWSVTGSDIHLAVGSPGQTLYVSEAEPRRTETSRPSADVWLTPADPEPPAGTIVESEDGYRWWRDLDHMGSRCNWFTMAQLTNPGRHDPESWTKVAGNYGPVRIVLQLGDVDA